MERSCRPSLIHLLAIAFVSDGQPSQTSYALDSQEVADWESFLVNTVWNGDTSGGSGVAYAVGIGSGISGADDDLEDVAYPNVADGSNPIVLEDQSINKLTATLSGTLENNVAGNILTNDDFSTDGPGGIASITIDGTTYSYDPNANEITNQTTLATVAGSTLFVTTVLGGTLLFEFADVAGSVAGDFSYSSGSVASDQTESFDYVIVDSDGSTAGSTLSILVEDTIRANPDIDYAIAATTTTGNVLTGVDGDLGANHSAHLFADDIGTPPDLIRAIEHDGTTYTLNAAGNGIDITGGPSSLVSFNAATGKIILDTAEGGRIVFDMKGDDVGSYAYVAPAGVVLPAETLFTTNFSSTTQSFSYSDDVFRGTSGSGNEAAGTRETSGGDPGGYLRVTLGSIGGNSAVDDLSGGYARSFTLTEAREVQVTFSYRAIFADTFESNEYGQVLASVDGQLVGTNGHDYINQFYGNGSSSSNANTGWQTVTLDLGTLEAGSHTLNLGGYLSDSSWNQEGMTIDFDNVTVTALESTTTADDEVFTYTLEDANGDTDTATLTIDQLATPANSGNQTLTGTSGDDLFRPGAGTDTVNGQGGIDTVSYEDSPSGVHIDMTASIEVIDDGFGSSDNLAGIEVLIGSNFADQLTGNATTVGLFGGGGNDVIVGGTASEIISGGLGSDTLTGGGGTDTFYYDAGTLAGTDVDTITDFGLNDDKFDIHELVGDVDIDGSNVNLADDGSGATAVQVDTGSGFETIAVLSNVDFATDAPTVQNQGDGQFTIA